MDFSHGQNRVPVNVRVDIDLHQRLVAEAERAVRTLPAEIIFRLRKSFEQQSENASGKAA
jgi:predicted HicB family RNase H-like nuclease